MIEGTRERERERERECVKVEEGMYSLLGFVCCRLSFFSYASHRRNDESKTRRQQKKKMITKGNRK